MAFCPQIIACVQHDFMSATLAEKCGMLIACLFILSIYSFLPAAVLHYFCRKLPQITRYPLITTAAIASLLLTPLSVLVSLMAAAWIFFIALAIVQTISRQNGLPTLRKHLLALICVLSSIVLSETISFDYIFNEMLSGARSKSRKISCASNLKQMGLALKQYAMDYSEWFPEVPSPEAFQRLVDLNYLSDASVYSCPGPFSLHAKYRIPAKIIPGDALPNVIINWLNPPEPFILKKLPAGARLTDEFVSYVYWPGWNEMMGVDTPIAWDKPGNHKGTYGNIMFSDGHTCGFTNMEGAIRNWSATKQ